MRRARAFLGWALVPLALAAGCDPKLSVCDIAGRECQEDIYYTVLRLRGDGVDPFAGLPPIRVITQEEYRQELVADEAARAASTSPEDRAVQATIDAAFALLGFIEPGGSSSGTSIDDLVQNVAAYYSETARDVTVISRPAAGADEQADSMETLAHEFVHAVQDREMNLRQPYTTDDEAAAQHALIEGDASLYEVLFRNELQADIGDPWNVDQGNIVTLFAQWGGDIYDRFAELGSPLFFPQIMIYPLGGSFLAEPWSRGGNAAVRRAYADAPRHAVGFLAGADPVAIRSCNPPIPAGYRIPARLGGVFQLGAFYFYSFLRAWGIAHATALAVARQWTGESLAVTTSADGQSTAVSWQIALGTAPPGTVTSALSATGGLSVAVESNSLIITATNAPAPLSWPAATGCF